MNVMLGHCVRYALLVCCCVLIAPLAAASQKRIALVVGNGAYEHVSKLPNPANDAKSISEKLRNIGFETVEGYDLNHDDLRQTVRVFAKKARNAELAIFFYAGHGIAVDGVNYLVPTDAVMDDPVDWEFQVFAVDDVMRHMRHADGASLILLDACRDNPFMETLATSMGTSTRSLGQGGLSVMDPDVHGDGMAIAFATSPGNVAEDGHGEHSPFTQALLDHIDAENTSFAEIMGRVTGDVYKSTNERQRPWLNSSLTGSIYLNPVKIKSAQTVASIDATAASSEINKSSLDIQKVLFETARSTNDPADYVSYLEMFPEGVFASQARNAVKRLSTDPLAGEGSEAVVAAVATSAPHDSAFVETVTRTLGTPLELTVTDYVKSKPSSSRSEQLLFLSDDLRANIQAMLNNLGISVGHPDGQFGRKTRNGIGMWQQRHGLPATGYLNQLQLNLLMASMDTGYLSYRSNEPSNTRVVTKTVIREVPAKESDTQGNNAASELLNGFFKGLGEGIGRAIID